MTSQLVITGYIKQPI